MQPYEKYSHLTSLSQPQNFSVSGLNQNFENQSCQCVYGITEPGVSLTPTATTKKSFSIDSILGTRRENTESFTLGSDPIMQTFPVSGPGSVMRQDRNLCEFPLVPSFGQYGNLGFPDFLTSDGANLLTANEARDWFDKPKRMRTIFTVDQLERLEEEFVRQQYMVGTERYYLAMELGLTETQVKVWFQNRRIKWRKQILERQQKKYPRA